MSSELLSKAYDPTEVERRWYPIWEERGYFTAEGTGDGPSFCLMIPPPNVTGALHIGHAFTNTLQDIIVRWKRMSGYDTLWLPGLDHAGIATQMVVERELAKDGTRKEDLGRDEFERRVWEWKEKSGGRILEQLRVLGFSFDWSRERFTLDEQLSRAVREVFVSLYEQDLVYRGDYIVNWCPRCVTALSDLEVENEPEPGSLWEIRYPAKDGGSGVVVATTRPETMLGDAAIAVHPADERYAALVGKHVVLPILEREIPVVADTFVDREFGTGAVKVTPAHDPNDFEAGQRLDLASINIMDERAVLNENAGPFAGQDRFEARKGVVARLERDGLLVKTTSYQVPLGRCQRCRTVVEPRLSRQWFARMQPLAEPAIAAVEDGRIRFTPDQWSKTYFEWMRNIRDWCISRQLWWGHRIPAWTCSGCDELLVARDAPAACNKCGGTALTQDPDVLDTWFSSGLFPFSTLGWPEKTPDLARFYPNDFMMTGFDIIFFWVARMIMLGMRFAGDVPFRRVFINGLVRDEHGDKMSKTKGNDVDPLEVAEEHGADALRFTLAALATPGNDPSLSVSRLKGYRAFINKFWNASRFVLMNLDGEVADGYDFSRLPLHSRWILGRVQQVAETMDQALEEFRFDLAANTIYHFLWDELCDWYIEACKLDLADAERGPIARAVLLEVLDTALRLAHPIIPFVTEEIWQRLPSAGETIVLAPYPRSDAAKTDAAAIAEMRRVMAIVTGIRTIRATYSVDPKKKIDVTIVAADSADREFVQSHSGSIVHLARLERLEVTATAGATDGVINQALDGMEIHVPAEGMLDVTAERERLGRQLIKLEKELSSLTKRLGNPRFIEKAKPELVRTSRDRLVELEDHRTKLSEAIRALGAA